MVAATVTDCLERARECAARAESMTGAEKVYMLAVAEAWRTAADEAAKEAAKAKGKPTA